MLGVEFRKPLREKRKEPIDPVVEVPDIDSGKPLLQARQGVFTVTADEVKIHLLIGRQRWRVVRQLRTGCKKIGGGRHHEYHALHTISHQSRRAVHAEDGETPPQIDTHCRKCLA